MASPCDGCRQLWKLLRSVASRTLLVSPEKTASFGEKGCSAWRSAGRLFAGSEHVYDAKYTMEEQGSGATVPQGCCLPLLVLFMP